MEITFAPVGEHTLVRMVHSGRERFGAAGPERRSANRTGWSGVLHELEAACRNVARVTVLAPGARR